MTPTHRVYRGFTLTLGRFGPYRVAWASPQGGVSGYTRTLAEAMLRVDDFLSRRQDYQRRAQSGTL